MSPFRLFGRPGTEADAEAAVPDVAPAYRPPHSGGSARRRPAADRADRKGRRARVARPTPPEDAPESASWQDAGLRWAAGSTAWGAAPPRYGAEGNWCPPGSATAGPPPVPGAAGTRWGAAPGRDASPPGTNGSAAATQWGSATGHDTPPPRGAKAGVAAARVASATSGGAAATQWGATSAAGTAAAGWAAADGDY